MFKFLLMELCYPFITKGYGMKIKLEKDQVSKLYKCV